jgi:NAD(P)H dehydrogenase (quinone)
MGAIFSYFDIGAQQTGAAQPTPQDGAQEPTLHLGLIIVGPPYTFQGQMGVSEVIGNSPYPRAATAAEGH